MLLKRYCLLSFLIFFGTCIFASKIDSLRSAERLASEPSVRFDLNLQLSEAFLDTEPDSFHKYLQISEQFLQQAPNDYRWAKYLGLKGKTLMNQSKLDSAVKVLTRAEGYAEASKDTVLMAQTQYLLSFTKIRFGPTEEVKNHLEKGLNLLGPEKEGDSGHKLLSRMHLYGGLGLYYQRSGNFPLALQNYFEAERIGSSYQLPTARALASVPNNLAMIYLDQENYDLALEYYQKAYDVALKRNMSPGLIKLIKGNIGIVYNRIGDHQKSTPILEEALEAYQKSQHTTGQMLILIEFARQYRSKKDFVKSDSFLTLVDPLIANSSPTKYYLESVVMAGQNALDQNKITTATKEANKAYELAHQLGDLNSLVLATELKKNLSHRKQNFQEAYQIQEEYLLYSDSLLNQRNIRKLESLRSANTIEQQALENENLLKQQDIQTQVIAQQQIIIGLIVFGLLLSLFFIFQRVKLHREQKQISDRLKRRTEALQIAKSEAEEATRSKAEFLSIMSHEIRTPMNAVIGMTHLLLDENPRPSQIEYLKTLQFSGNNLLSLINDILDFSKISAGKMELENISFNLRELANGIVQAVGIRASDKGLEVSCEYSSEIGEFYQGDPVRLGQILTNLLGNAIKFTAEGEIKLCVEPGPEGSLSFKVIDTGIGIAREKQAQIFERFAQSDTEIARKYGGTGLGLAITKDLLELMGSSIKLKSTEGVGSTFYFHLKLTQVEDKRSTKSVKVNSPIEDMGSLEGVRVLLAEDNRINQIVCSRFLQKWDIDYELAENGREVMALLENQQFHLILMDIQMPEMDGLEATREIRSAEGKAFQDIPIIALTASILDESMESIQEVGMSDLIGKPFDPKLLFQKISHYSES